MSRLFCSLFQGVFATVFDPSQKKKRKKSKFDPQGNYLVSVVHITRRGGIMEVMIQIRTVAFSVVLRQYAFPAFKRLCFPTENLSTNRKQVYEIKCI